MVGCALAYGFLIFRDWSALSSEWLGVVSAAIRDLLSSFGREALTDDSGVTLAVFDVLCEDGLIATSVIGSCEDDCPDRAV